MAVLITRFLLLASMLELRALSPFLAGAPVISDATLERTTQSIPILRVGGGGHIAADGVSLNGLGSHRFVIDTGASTSTFQLDAARKLGIQSTYTVQVDVVGGVTTLPAARVKLCIKDVCDENSEIVFTKLAAAKLDRRVRGVLGIDFLTKAGFVLDNRRNELMLGPAKPKYQGAVVPLESVSGRLAVRAKDGDTGDSINLVLDSGSPCLVLFGRHRGNTAAGQRRPVTLTNSLGHAQSGVEEFVDLRLGSYTLRKLPAVVLPSEPADDPARGDGLIPTSMFEAIVVQPSGSYALIQNAEK